MSKKNPPYRPPYTLTGTILHRVATICEKIGLLSTQAQGAGPLRLRRLNRIRTIQGSLAIEGNTLSLEQITAILEGKRVIAPPREIREVSNAIAAYECLEQWRPDLEKDLLTAHHILMAGLVDDAGKYRRSDVGVLAGEKVIHIGPQAHRVEMLMRELLKWLHDTGEHPLIASSVFHYEFEFIHPFTDGNGRMGRLWQTLILSRWSPLFIHIPVESIVHEHQSEYYNALQESTRGADSAPFIEFLLKMILDAIAEVSTPQADPQATPQVERLLASLEGTMSRRELQEALGLKDRRSFQDRYITPALEAGLIERTLAEKPSSPLQKYRLSNKGRKVLRKQERKKKG